MFYQVNPVQTHKLYNKAIEMADFKGEEVVMDAIKNARFYEGDAGEVMVKIE